MKSGVAMLSLFYENADDAFEGDMRAKVNRQRGIISGSTPAHVRMDMSDVHARLFTPTATMYSPTRMFASTAM